MHLLQCCKHQRSIYFLSQLQRLPMSVLPPSQHTHQHLDIDDKFYLLYQMTFGILLWFSSVMVTGPTLPPKIWGRIRSRLSTPITTLPTTPRILPLRTDSMVKILTGSISGYSFMILARSLAE